MAPIAQAISPPAATTPVFMEPAAFAVLDAAVPLPGAPETAVEAEDVVAATSAAGLLVFGAPEPAPGAPVAAGVGEAPAPPGAALPGPDPEPLPAPDPEPSGAKVG